MDLGSLQTIHYVKIWDRSDCCAGRIAGFQVHVTSVDDIGTATSTGTCVNPFGDITEATATIDMGLTPGGRCNVGRYVWVSLPGNGKYLTLCEVAVFQKRPWVWRQLSGVAEIGKGKKAEQSSTELCCAGGDAARALDGDTSNNDYNRGSCTHTMSNYNQPNNAAWWLVDLGRAYDLTRLQVWPRTDCCFDDPYNRNTRWVITAGMSRDQGFGVAPQGVPDDLADVTSWDLPFATPTRSRYVVVSRECAPSLIINQLDECQGYTPVLLDNDALAPTASCSLHILLTAYSTVPPSLAGPFVAGTDNILSICELKIYANLLLDQPSPRQGSTVTGFGGYLMMFGGTSSTGFKLNDLRLFDTVNRRWLPYVAPLNTPPVPRSNAAMLVLSSSRVALFGGASSTDVLGDVFYWDASPCPPLDRTGWTNIRTSHSGSFEWFDCAAGFTHTNGGAPMICDVTTGTWFGVYNLATRMVCLPVGPAAPVVTGVSAVSPTSALVTFNPPGNTAGITRYIVEAVADATWTERFNSINGPTDLLSNWRWEDPKATSRYSFPGGNVRIDAAPNSDCSVASPRGCPWLSRGWPAGVPNDDFIYEAWVEFDSNVVQGRQFAGIGLILDNSAQGTNDTLQIEAGLYRSESAWQIYWSAGVPTWWYGVNMENPSE